jgi:sporulation protein YlmC with PRC-barrel domain
MRLSELLGVDVVDADGRRVGAVADVRLVQDGPLLGAYAAWRVSGLIVVEKRRVRLLGYERLVGPTLLRLLIRRLAGGVWFIPWDEVTAVSPGRVKTGLRHHECDRLEDLPDRTGASADR